MNIEHRTLNVQHRIMSSVNLKKTEQSKSTLWNLSALGGFCGSLVLRSIKRSVINIGCSMFDVRCSIFSLFRPGEISYEVSAYQLFPRIQHPPKISRQTCTFQNRSCTWCIVLCRCWRPLSFARWWHPPDRPGSTDRISCTCPVQLQIAGVQHSVWPDNVFRRCEPHIHL